MLYTRYIANASFPIHTDSLANLKFQIYAKPKTILNPNTTDRFVLDKP